MSTSVAPLAPRLKLLRIVIAQVTGIIGVVFTYPIIGIVLVTIVTLFGHRIGDILPPDQTIPDIVLQITILFIDAIRLLSIGAAIALFQWFFLRQWIKNSFYWGLSNSIVTAFFVWMLYSAWLQFVYWLYQGGGSIDNRLFDGSYVWPLVFISAPFGVLGGFLIGAISSFWLNSGRKLYVIINSLTWAAASPLLIFLYLFIITLFD